MVEEIKKIYFDAKELVENRWNEFLKLKKSDNELLLFSELSFCVLTANWSASGGIKAQKEIGDGFYTLSLSDLEKALKKVGHRFPKARAKYIYENRWIVGKLINLIKSYDVYTIREYLVKNIKGIGWKEASHFLRNIGFCEVAILDKHILRMLHKYKYIDEIPKSWSKKRYLEIEKIFNEISNEFGECPGKFDLYVWYYIKGKVEK